MEGRPCAVCGEIIPFDMKCVVRVNKERNEIEVSHITCDNKESGK